MQKAKLRRSAADGRFKKAERCSRAGNASPSSGSSATATSGTEFVVGFDGEPSCTVSIMEFSEGKAARETQYFGDPFKPGPSRVPLG